MSCICSYTKLYDHQVVELFEKIIKIKRDGLVGLGPVGVALEEGCSFCLFVPAAKVTLALSSKYIHSVALRPTLVLWYILKTS